MASGKGMAPETAKEYVPPHERDSGWDAYDLDNAAHHLERAEQIKSNPKFMNSIQKHVADKAKEHADMAHRLKELVKGGRVSPKAMQKMDRD